ncbi:MAG: M4 family metallopeptidase [Coriobacteriales bacterium]|nr:M4 family metallopeptidase [Coriobacteriales bacterium]
MLGSTRMQGGGTGKARPLSQKCRVILAAFLASLALAAAVFSPALLAQAAENGLKGLSTFWDSQTQESPDGEPSTLPGGGAGSDNLPDSQYNTIPQLTSDDILRMNHGNVTMLYTNGYLTFLQGTFYDGEVTNVEEGIEALLGIASLVGLSKGSEFYGVYGDTNSYGYTVYTLKQRYGDITIKDAILKIVVGPDNHTAGLVSSFTPNVGIAPASEETSISASDAEAVVQRKYKRRELTFYSEYTRQTSVTIANVAYHAWAVFTSYPNDITAPEGHNYLEHIIGYDGSYLMNVPVTSPEEIILGDNAITEQALAWFDGMEPATYTGTVTLHDGTTKEITVPVVRDANGTYYLADASRHILLADCYSYLYRTNIVPWTSQDNTGWPNHYLITYNTYIQVYDLFAARGQVSVDGFGAPILILTNLCDSNRNPVNNANYMGMSGGWALFGASEINDYGECIDVAAHEYTHGISEYSRGGDIYQNETGAINEALSDIMGNICQYLSGDTTDTEWLIAERSGVTLRSMSFPWLYHKPVTIGGKYYIEPTDSPDIDNDLGGVHSNSLLLGNVAWRLIDSGMDPEEAFSLWMDVIRLITPYSGLREIHAALLFAAEMHNLDIEWFGLIDMYCEQAGF